MTAYIDISCLQPRESAARGNFRSVARATNYYWHRADYSSRYCSHPQQIACDRATANVSIVHVAWQRRVYMLYFR